MFVFKGTAVADASKDEDERKWRVADHYNIQRLGKQPFYTMLQPTLHHRSLTEDTRRPSRPQPRSKSNSSAALHTLHEGSRPLPAPSFDRSAPGISADRRSLSSGSIHRRGGSSDSFGKALMARGSRLLRRQNSKHDLTSLKTLEWLEEVNGRDDLQGNANRSGSWPSPIRSIGDDASPRYNISEPFNFQHLTHTTPQHVERIQRTNHEDLVSEFSAIRAAQAPRRELRGIKAMDIQQGIYFSKASASDTSSQPQTGYSTSTPGSPAHERSRIGSHSNEASVPARNLTNKRSKENFSQPSPSYHTAQSSPTSPPPRSSSRNKVPDFFTFDQESPTCGPFEPDISIEESEPFEYFPAAWKNGAYDSSLPHALTTPDDTAHSIRPPPFSLIRTELAGVPEEDEISEGKRSSLTTSIVRSATPPSIRHAKSFPSTKSSLAPWSGAPPHPAGEDDEQLPRQLTKSVCLLEPDMEEYKEEVPVRPRTSRRISLRKEESWEDVIDYCYEHQAEADCNFDWELASHFGEPNTALASSVGRSADSGTNNFDYATNTNVANDTLVDGEIGSGQSSSANLPSALVSLQRSLPDLQSPTPGSVESSFSSISEAVTPLPVESTVRRKASTSNSKGWSTSVPSAPFVMPEDSTPEYVFDDFYQKMLASHAACNPQLSLQTGLVDGSTISNSPRSSRSPISKSNSQESFWHSQVGAAPGRHRNTGSVGSLPELIQCRSVDKSDVVDHTAEQNAVIDASDTPADSSRHQRSLSLAKDVALKSMLSKVMTAEGREVLDAQLPLHPAFRDRACSDTPALPPPPQPPIARRMRSPSSASNLSSRRTSRASYSLFPSNAIR